MTSDRTYRRGLLDRAGTGRDRESLGQQFDPEVVDALTEALDLAPEREQASEA